MITEEEKIDYQKRDIKYLEEILFIHCQYENFQGIEYLLMSSDLKKNVDIHTQEDRALIVACLCGKIKVVKYLLTSPDLKEHANIHAQNGNSLIAACRNGHLEIIKYLLTSPDLKEKINIHIRNDLFFRSINDNQFGIIDYLIFDYNIKKTEDINHYIKDKPELIKLFERREFNKNLNENLINTNGFFSKNSNNKVKL